MSNNSRNEDATMPLNIRINVEVNRFVSRQENTYTLSIYMYTEKETSPHEHSRRRIEKKKEKTMLFV